MKRKHSDSRDRRRDKIPQLLGKMHSVDVEPEPQDILLDLGLLIVEGRQANHSSPKGFEEGPHCLRQFQKAPRNHACTNGNHLCIREEAFRKHVDVLWKNNVPLCIEVLLCSDCPCGKDRAGSSEVSPLPDPGYVLLEQWTITSCGKRAVDNGRATSPGPGVTNGRSILHAVRSFLHFSQLSAWFAVSKGDNPKNVMYRVTIPGENFASKFSQTPVDHEFPTVHFKNHVLKVNVKSLPRVGNVPSVSCFNSVCSTRSQAKRSQSPPIGEIIGGFGPNRSMVSPPRFLGAVLASPNSNRWKCRNIRSREALSSMESPKRKGCGSSGSNNNIVGGRLDYKKEYEREEGSRSPDLQLNSSETNSTHGEPPTPTGQDENVTTSEEGEDGEKPKKSRTKSRPNAPSDPEDFVLNLGSAAARVFNKPSGLPLTSSPAPLRKGQDRFDFDSTLVSATRITSRFRRGCHPPRFSEATRALVGTFEESVLNGRIEPVSTVQGFTAEIGASGSFCPRHIHLPVTVFFYTFCDNDKISTPYLAHVDLGEQGYCVPRKGTVQVTLFNPLRTVIKMFVVQFNLETMPSNSQTFLRQRTYFMPLGESDSHPNAQKWLRYLIHLRFASNADGQIFLHTDVRMVIFRKSDADTATGFDMSPHELRSFTYAPQNPNYSSRISVPSSTQRPESSRQQQQQTSILSTSPSTSFPSSSSKSISAESSKNTNKSKVQVNYDNSYESYDTYRQYDEREYVNQSYDEVENPEMKSNTIQQQQRVSVP